MELDWRGAIGKQVYSRLPSFVLGFHGCDRSIAAEVIAGKRQLKPSRNRYDWLGEGIYFWENNPVRAMEFVRALKGKRRKGKRAIRTPAVVGAVIDLGVCFNLLDSKYLQMLRDGYATLQQWVEEAGKPLPANRPLTIGGELLLRDLDCAVINTVHASREEQQLPQFDTVRSAFVEGDQLFPESSFREKNHIQICVRNPSCIKGYFWPMAGESG